MKSRYTIELRVVDNWHFKNWTMATDNDEFPMFSERFVEDVKAPQFSMISFEEVVKVLHKREFRKELLIEAAKKLSHRLADYIEDSEGWHGVDRRERIKEHKR